MAGNASFTDIITTTLQGYSGEIADNITKNNALLNEMNKRKNIDFATGRSIVQELDYQENSTVKWYSGYEILDTSASDTLTAAEYAYKQLSGSVVLSGLEQIQNSGKEAIHSLVKSRIRNLERSLQNAVGAGLFATGTGNSGKEIGGLRLLVADAGAGTVGGIDASANAFWANKYDSTSALSTTNVLSKYNSMFMSLVRGTDKPNMIVADLLHYKIFWNALQANQRFIDTDKANSGFTALSFNETPFLYDANCPANHTYFLNTDFLFFRPAKDRNFVPLAEKASINQDAIVVPMVWAGNMTCSNRSLQGVVLNP